VKVEVGLKFEITFLTQPLGLSIFDPNLVYRLPKTVVSFIQINLVVLWTSIHHFQLITGKMHFGCSFGGMKKQKHARYVSIGACVSLHMQWRE